LAERPIRASDLLPPTEQLSTALTS
jgi:hypothetical protein